MICCCMPYGIFFFSQAAEKMPTPNRVSWIKAKAQYDFRKNKTLSEKEEIDLHIIVGETNLDSIEVQAEHLTKVFNMDWNAEFNRAFQPPKGIEFEDEREPQVEGTTQDEKQEEKQEEEEETNEIRRVLMEHEAREKEKNKQ